MKGELYDRADYPFGCSRTAESCRVNLQMSGAHLGSEEDGRKGHFKVGCSRE